MLRQPVLLGCASSLAGLAAWSIEVQRGEGTAGGAEMLTLVADIPGNAERLIGRIGVEEPLGVAVPLEGAETLMHRKEEREPEVRQGTADSCWRASTTGELIVIDEAPDTGADRMRGLLGDDGLGVAQ